VSAHLLKQNKKCSDTNTCLYRNNEGLKCAIGALIDDKVFKLEHNESGLSSEGVMEMLKASRVHINKKSMNLMHDLQVTHDNSEVKQWKTQLKSIAKAYKLECKL